VLHRDIKLDNIFVHFNKFEKDEVFKNPKKFQEYKRTANLNEDINLVIGDLGFARELDPKEMAETLCGSPLFMAPEILKGSSYNAKVDVWSIGTMFYEMIAGFVPFTGNSRFELEKAIERGDYWIQKDVRLSLEGLSFLNSCLQYNPDDRMSLEELINH
jgi:serine/threonine-protein kinase ULK2